MRRISIASCVVISAIARLALAAEGAPDLIVHHAKVVTVDPSFSVASAMSVKDGKIARVGTDEEVLATKDQHTRVLDLGGKTVLPGLIDSHVHPAAALTEFDHDIPEME